MLLAIQLGYIVLYWECFVHIAGYWLDGEIHSEEKISWELTKDHPGLARLFENGHGRLSTKILLVNDLLHNHFSEDASASSWKDASIIQAARKGIRDLRPSTSKTHFYRELRNILATNDEYALPELPD